MKNRVTTFLIYAALITTFASCTTGGGDYDESLPPGVHKVEAEEVIQTDRYTYIRVSEGDSAYWTAIGRSEILEGGTYYWSTGFEMQEFTSNDLKRTFRSIMFVEDFSDKPPVATQPAMTAPHGGSSSVMATGRQPVPEKQGIKVEKADGGYTIAELYADRNNLAGKKVKVRGEVVKYSPGIMNRNWVHLQDGTSDAGNYDLTVTTLEEVQTGEVVLFEGIISTGKDFGSGYFYELILEEGTRIR